MIVAFAKSVAKIQPIGWNYQNDCPQVQLSCNPLIYDADSLIKRVILRVVHEKR